MIKIYPYDTLGHVDHGWLNARHHFSFASYQNPHRLNFGALRVINDDIIKAQSGFAPHSHQNMEIITYIRSGGITHQDSNGNKGRLQAGEIQVMSAGSGIEHSEYNLEDEDTNLYQIWIIPNKRNVPPRWDSKKFPKAMVKNTLSLLVSGNESTADASSPTAPLFIYQDAHIYGGQIEAHTHIKQVITHQAYLLLSKGRIKLEGKMIEKGDGVEITNSPMVEIEALEQSEILLIDVPIGVPNEHLS